MGIIRRQAIKGSIANYIGVFLGFLTTLYILPEFLAPEQLGVYRFVVDTGVFLGSFITLGMPNVIFKFFPHIKNDKTNHNGFIIYMFLVPILGFIIYYFLIVCFEDSLVSYFSKGTKGYEQYFKFVIPIAFFFALLITFETFSSVNNRIVVPKLVREVFIKILLIIVFFCFHIGYFGFMSTIKLLAVIYFLGLVAVLIYLKILGNKIFPFKSFKRIPKDLRKKMFSFGAFIFLTAIGSGLLNKLDMFVVTSELGFQATAIYTTAFYIAAMVEIPARSLYQISTPAITTAFKENNIKNIEIIYKKITQNLIIISGCLMLLLLSNLDNIFYLIPKEDIYSQGKYVVIFIAIAKFIDTGIGINFSILSYSKYYFYILPIFLLVGISNYFLNYWFIDIWGLSGSAIATLLVIIVNNIVVLLIIYSKYRIHPFQKKNIYELTALLVTFLIANYVINFDNVYLSIFFKSSFIVAFLGIITIKYNFSEDISAIYNKVIQLIKNIKA